MIGTNITFNLRAASQVITKHGKVLSQLTAALIIKKLTTWYYHFEIGALLQNTRTVTPYNSPPL